MSLASTSPGLLSQTRGYLRASSIFGEGGTVDAYLRFETALAEVQGALGVIPAEAVSPITSICRRELLDMETLRRDAAAVGYPIVPLVSMLSTLAGEHGQWVHYGTTTQDVMDTAQVLQLRSALQGVLSDVTQVEQQLARICHKHRHTLMAGRSKLQHGVPISFGYKVAVWLDQIVRARQGLVRAMEEASVLQFGGAAGTLASLGDRGTALRQALATRLSLSEPSISWHVSRDRMAALASAAAILLAAMGKMAVDISLMVSTEVGELAEPAAEGRGSSSTMPQKRNPVICEAIIEAARNVQHVPGLVLDAMLQEHERGIGHGYRERAAICDAIRHLAGSASLAVELLLGLEVNEERMRDNLATTRGLIHSEAVMMHLAQTVGRVEAHHILGQISRHVVVHQGSDLQDALRTEMNIEVPDYVLSEAAQIGQAQQMIDQVLREAGWHCEMT
ncbi:class-II fumarase/aspartase family protein [Pseudorhizobium marinum]|uniref:class-II fumarase/aspartase family protein n=1 Tax=Pseudorhizobium marinum TaxID=1496690 RepID=UPI00068BF8D6|nr:adenylosuccinate lyase family protein [Pseudorhizobium marinum]